MTPAKLILPLFTLAILGAAVGQSQEKKIVMTHVKYDGLKQEILKHRGKVVVVDFWATWCPPCRRSFPKFIKFQEKYGEQGLVVISVSLDSVEKEGAVALANKFLTQQQSPLRNLLLDEPPALWDKQFEFKSLPFYYAFDRHGKWARFRGYDYKDKNEDQLYEDLETTFVQMLKEK